jgi:hypothetical protein
MASPQQKVDYFVSQAKSFYEPKEFQEAVNTASYVLSAFDKNSVGAKNLLEKAKQQIAGGSPVLGDWRSKRPGGDR